MATDYELFLERKAQLASAGGFTPTVIPEHLFDFQKSLVDDATYAGVAAAANGVVQQQAEAAILYGIAAFQSVWGRVA